MTLLSGASGAELLSAMSCSLSAVSSERTAGEKALQTLQQQPDFDALCCAALGNAGVSERLRQLAGLVLRDYVRKHWEATLDARQKLGLKRALLEPVLIREPATKIRTAISLVVAAVAELDEGEWEELLPQLVQYMNSDSVELTRGAISCLVRLSEEVHPDQLLHLTSAVAPALLRVVRDQPNHPNLIRMQSLAIFRMLVDGAPSCEDPAFKQLLVSIGPQWLETFHMLLSQAFADKLQRLQQHQQLAQDDMLGIQAESCRVIASYTKFLPSMMEKYLPVLLEQAWGCMNALLPLYESEVARASASDAAEPHAFFQAQTLETGAEPAPVALQALLSIISAVVWSRRASVRSLLANQLSAVVSVAIRLLQQPQEAEPDLDSFWMSEQGVATLRDDGISLLSTLLHAFGNSAASAMRESIVSMYQDGDVQRLPALKEAAILAIGVLLQDQQNEIETGALLEIVMMELGSSVLSVRARALHCIGLFASQLPASVAGSVLQGVTAALSSAGSSSMLLRVCAARAVSFFCEEPLTKELFRPAVAAVLAELCNTIVVCKCEEALHALVETVQVVLQVDPSVIVKVQDGLVPLMLSIWQSNYNDSIMVDSILDVLRVLANQPECLPFLRDQCSQVVRSALSQADTANPAVLEFAIEVLKLLVASSSSSSAPASVPTEMVSVCVPSILRLLSNAARGAGDPGVFATAQKCLASFVEAASTQMHSLQFEQQPLSQAIVQVLGEVLMSKAMPDSAWRSSGSLVQSVLQRLHPDLSSSVLLLARVLHRLAAAETPKTSLRLLRVFATLAHQDAPALLDLLERIGTIELPTAQSMSALELLMRKWLEASEDLQVSSFTVKANVGALARLLLLRDARLGTLSLRGYAIVDTTAPRRTRSSRATSALRYSLLPLPSKIVSVLAQAWSTSRSSSAADPFTALGLEGAELDDVDDDDEEDEDFGDVALDIGDEFADDDDVSDDDNEDNPLNQIEIQPFIAEVFARLASADMAYMKACLEPLNDDDRNIVSEILS